ncbi:MAG: glycosyltransferase family 2 protein [Candidatus Omnitrophica bacterium]|nr:glycosyltransferase family 2 protein [Candidatus Omnitrophota bacterium]
MQEPKVCVIIINYNGIEYVLDAIDSVQKLLYGNYEIIVVDNCSTDGSQEAIKKGFPDVRLIVNRENLGSSGGYNRGMRESLTNNDVQYVFLINCDAKADPDCLKKLVVVAESDHQIGIVQPKVLRMDNPHIIDSTGHIFRFGRIIDRGHDQIDKGQFDNKLEIIGACSAACLYSRKMIEDIGMYDEEYGSNYEDAELSWRAHNRGWRAKFAPEAIVYHKRGGFKKKSEERWRKHYFLSLDSKIMALKRYGSINQKFLFILASIIYPALKSTLRKLMGKSNLGVANFCKRFFRFIFSKKTKKRGSENV